MAIQKLTARNMVKRFLKTYFFDYFVNYFCWFPHFFSLNLAWNACNYFQSFYSQERIFHFRYWIRSLDVEHKRKIDYDIILFVYFSTRKWKKKCCGIPVAYTCHSSRFATLWDCVLPKLNNSLLQLLIPWQWFVFQVDNKKYF